MTDTRTGCRATLYHVTGPCTQAAGSFDGICDRCAARAISAMLDAVARQGGRS